jgi:hypothetical protein
VVTKDMKCGFEEETRKSIWNFGGEIKTFVHHFDI